MGWIETSAVHYFCELINRTQFLESEKNILTDGYVNVYSELPNAQSDHSLKDGGFVGRLPVQVKGRLVSKTGVPPSSFSLKRHELENLVKIGGAVLVVVGLPRRGTENKPVPMYADLAPRNARYVLDQMAPGQKEKAVKLNQFPTDQDEIVSLISHLQERLSLTNVIRPNGHLINNAERLTVTTPQRVDYSRPQLLGGPGSSAIISVNGPDGESQVIDTILQITPEDYGLTLNNSLAISCGDVVFNETRRRKRRDDRVEIFVSPGISFVIKPNRECSFHLRFQTRLYYVAKDVSFLHNLALGYPIRFNGTDTLTFSGDTTGLERYTSTRGYLSDLERLCERFGIDPKLFPVADLPHQTVDALENLVLHQFYGARIDLQSEVPMRHVIDLSGQALQLVWTNWRGVWEVHSLFDWQRMTIGAVLNDSEISDRPDQITAYELFSAAELSSILNLNPAQIVEAYRNIGSKRAVDLASGTVAKLITAADATPQRRREFLSMAAQLNGWVSENEPENVYIVLNGLQISYRLGELGRSDVETLENIWHSAQMKQLGEDSLVVEIAAGILLDNLDGVNYLLAQMPREERERFEKSPIMHLFELHGAYVLGEPNNDDEWGRIEDEIQKEYANEIALYRLGKPTESSQN